MHIYIYIYIHIYIYTYTYIHEVDTGQMVESREAEVWVRVFIES